MTLAVWSLSTLCLIAVFLHFATCAIAARRCRPCSAGRLASGSLPAVTVIRPVCGIDNFSEQTLHSSFGLDFPRYEILFCVARENDPVVPLVRRLIAENPAVCARLLVGDDRISDNPKLNNVVKGWREAAHEWIVIADSNVFLPRDYIQQLMAAWRADTGLVCAPPIGWLPGGFWAEIECAFLNSYQARWQYAADSSGLGFAQGKSMLWRRRDLDRSVGLRALASEPAEDAAATKVVRGWGKRVRLVNAPFGQPLGARHAHEVWARQLRWARLRRATFGPLFAMEILTTGLVPVAAISLAALLAGWPVLPLAAATTLGWYGAEAALCHVARWPLTWRSLPAWVVRDILLPVLWTCGWLGRRFVWRGNEMPLLGWNRDLAPAETESSS